MLRAERLTKICELVNDANYVTVSEIMIATKASKSTVLRDINNLSKENRIQKTLGGVMSVNESTKASAEPSVRIKEKLYQSQKVRIAEKAMEFIGDCSSIFLDAGTTTLAIARKINEQLNRPLTVVTYDLYIAMELSSNPHVQVIIIGGTLRQGFSTATGYPAMKLIDDFRVDRIFLGADAVSLNDGILNYSVEDIAVKRALVDSPCQSIILVCDHSKFNRSSLYKVCNISRLARIITTNELSSAQVELLKAQSVPFDLV